MPIPGRVVVLGPRALLVAAGLCLVLGCQSSQPGSAAKKTDASGQRSIDAEPFAGLKALSQHQHQTPDAKAKTLPPPPGIEFTDVAPLAPEAVAPDSPAALPLDAALDTFKDKQPAGPKPA